MNRGAILFVAICLACVALGGSIKHLTLNKSDEFHRMGWQKVHDDPFFQELDPRERIIAIVLMTDQYDVEPAEELVLSMITTAMNEVFITGTDMAEAHCDEMMNLVVDRQVSKTWANCNALLQDIEQEYRVRVALMEDW